MPSDQDRRPLPGYAPDVPRPPVGFSIDVPDDWTVVDLNPETWEGWLDAFVDDRLTDHPEERPPARQALTGLLRRLHDERVFMAAVLASGKGATLLTAGATLSWREHGLHPAGDRLDDLRDAFADAAAAPGEDAAARRVDRIDLPAGGAVRVATAESVGPHTVTLTQYLVPVLDTGWLAVLTTTTGDPTLAPDVATVADTMAASLTFQHGE